MSRKDSLNGIILAVKLIFKDDENYQTQDQGL